MKESTQNDPEIVKQTYKMASGKNNIFLFSRKKGTSYTQILENLSLFNSTDDILNLKKGVNSPISFNNH